MNTIVTHVLRAVAARPGRLFQPVYICPISNPAAIVDELRAVTREHGMTVFPSAEEWKDAGETEGIVVCKAKEAAKIITLAKGGNVQVIAWGETMKALGKSGQEAVDEGLVVDPMAVPTDEGINLHHLARGIERAGHGLYAILTKEGTETALAHNLRMRMEAAGLTTTLGAAGEDSDITIVRIQPGMSGVDIGDIVERSEPEEHTIMIIANPKSWEDVARGQVWASAARMLPLDTGSSAPESEDETWPAMRLLLSSLPVLGAVDPKPMLAWTGWSPEGEMEIVNLLQQVARPGASSDITVFNDEQWARIKVRGETVAAIDMAGEYWDEEKLTKIRRIAKRGDEKLERVREDLITDRFRRLVQWPTARVVASKVSDDGARGSLRAGDLVFDLAGWLDERREQTSNRRGGGAVWQPEGPPPKGQSLAFAKQVYDTADGRRTAWQIDDLLGFGRDRILDIIASMELSGYVRFVSEDDIPMERPAEEVAAGYLMSGLLEEAQALLEKTKARGQLTAAGHALLASVLAINAGARAALPIMRYAMSSVESTAWLPIRLDAALMAARAGAGAVDVWRTLRDDLVSKSAMTGTGWGYKQYGIYGELAIRAGEEATATAVLKALRDSGLAAAAGIGRSLEKKLRDSRNNPG